MQRRHKPGKKIEFPWASQRCFEIRNIVLGYSLQDYDVLFMSVMPWVRMQGYTKDTHCLSRYDVFLGCNTRLQYTDVGCKTDDTRVP